MMLPFASATTMQFSHFASTPRVRYGGLLLSRNHPSFPSHAVSHFSLSWSVPPTPGREADCIPPKAATGKLMLGPSAAAARSRRGHLGNSPRKSMNTRFGLRKRPARRRTSIFHFPARADVFGQSLTNRKVQSGPRSRLLLDRGESGPGLPFPGRCHSPEINNPIATRAPTSITSHQFFACAPSEEAPGSRPDSLIRRS